MHTFAPKFSKLILGGKVLVLGFGKEQDNFNWSLAKLKTQQSLEEEQNSELVQRLRHLVKTLDIDRVYAPHPTYMNSEIVSPEDFKQQLMLGTETWGDLGGKEFYLFRGPQADGVQLPSRSAFIMSAADCALVVVSWRGQIWAAHAGRDSLIDKEYIRSDGEFTSKLYPSVVDSIMAEIPKKFHSEAEVYYGCTISKGPWFEHPVDHPEYGDYNKKMLTYIARQLNLRFEDREQLGENYWQRGQMDMQELIKAQFEHYGVQKFETDEVCTYSGTNPDGSVAWHSNRRDKVRRNLFVVIRK